LNTIGGLRARRCGGSGPLIIVLHGGPAAVGEAAPLARGLADSFRVIEPWQRGSGSEPLTVARHIADLRDLIEAEGTVAAPALVGESWGAMLALAYGAAHPQGVGPLALVASGTFDKASRARIIETLEERTGDELRERLERLEDEIPDPDNRLKRRYDLLSPLYDYSPICEDEDGGEAAGPFDMRAHTETWTDMVRLQELGVYPAAFSAITSPVLMLHGSYDPHPGQMIRASLEQHIPHLEYREFGRCGHRPWAEKYCRDEFFSVVRDWLLRHTT
jgi:pimeloyl-ACP methyl ester carboxylesterase